MECRIWWLGENEQLIYSAPTQAIHTGPKPHPGMDMWTARRGALCVALRGQTFSPLLIG